MGFSNDHLRTLATSPGARVDPGFELIIAFDYYDGPERGLALLSCGEGLRFSTLGDSRSRLFRSFELTPIEGTWWAQARSVPEVAAAPPSRPIVLPSGAGKAICELERQVFSAPATGHYVGVGGAHFEWLAVSAVGEEELQALRRLGGSPAGFESVHRLLKRRAQTRGEISA